MTDFPLPQIRPDREDLLYWHKLTDRELANTIAVDAWNLAAAVHVQTTRRTAQAQRLADDVARFSHRAAS